MIRQIYNFLVITFFIFITNFQAKGQVKILPLGNSITFDLIREDTRDTGDKISYRYHLYKLLTQAGYSFDFVGSERSGWNFLPPGFEDNGGFPGITNLQMLEKLKTGYLNIYNPDIILLEIGTNGLISDSAAEVEIVQLNSILDEVDNYERSSNRSVQVFLAQIISRANSTPYAADGPTAHYNQLMATMVSSRPSDKVTLINMETGAGIDYRYAGVGGDMHDLLHPVQSGFIKMAEKWFSYLNPYLAGLVNHAPELSGIEGVGLSYTEASGKVNITSSLAINDPEVTNLASAIVKINSGYTPAEDILSFANTAEISSSWNSVTGTLTLSGNASLASYQAALRSVQYENINKVNPSTVNRVITFSINDGFLNSNVVSRSVLLVTINNAPVLAGIENSALNYKESSGKVAISSTISIADSDNISLRSAAIKISGNYTAGEDVLSFTNSSGISSSWNSATATLTLTGNASLTSFQKALRNVQYENTNKINPSSAERTITYVVSDGSLSSNEISRTIQITLLNNAPALAGIENSTITYKENSGKIAVSSSISVADGDNNTLKSATIKIMSGFTSAEDVLSYNNTSGISSAWDSATGTLTLTGEASLADYQLALRSIQYENTNHNNPLSGDRTISFSVNDGAINSNVVSRIIKVLPVNTIPVIADLEVTPLNYNEDSGKSNVTSTITVNDLDNSRLKSAIVQFISGFKPSEDLLSFASTSDISSAWDAKNGILTLTGNATLASYQSALRSVQYENSNKGNPSTNDRVLSFLVNDGEGSSVAVSRTIKLITVNDPPLVSALESVALNYTEGDGKKLISSSIVISDTDSSNLQSATIKIASGYNSKEDNLTYNGTNNISALWDKTTGTLNLSGNASVAAYQWALRNVRYENTNIYKPDSTQRTITFAVNDGTIYSNSMSRIVKVININQPPQISIADTSGVMFTIGRAPINLFLISISDSDDSILSSAAIRFTKGYNPLDDNLVFTKQSTIQGSWNKKSGTLTLQGKASISEYQKFIRNIKYNNIRVGDNDFGNRKVSVGVFDGKDTSNVVERNLSLQIDSSFYNQKELIIKKAAIWPNPASDYVRIAFAVPLYADIKLELISPQGIVVKTEMLKKKSQSHELNVLDFENGIYFLRFSDKENNQGIFKIAIFK